MKLYNRNDKIFMDVVVNGKRIRKSLGLEWNKANLRIAWQEIAPNMIKELEEQKANLTLENALKKALERDKTKLRESSFVNSLVYYKTIAKFWGVRLRQPISEFVPYDIQDFADTLAKSGYASGTIKNILSFLSRAFVIAIKMQVITFNPVYKVEIVKKVTLKRVVYSKEQCKMLLDGSSGILQAFLYLAIYTGARSGEILALSKDKLEGNYITINSSKSTREGKITATKSGKSRRVLIAPALAEFLKTFDLDLFQATRYRVLQSAFIRLCNKLNLPYGGLHSLRHTNASLLLNDKVAPLVIKENLGHSTLKMLEEVYGHFTGYSTEDEEDIKKSLNF